MPSYPIEPRKLLEVAGALAPESAGRGRPSYTAHRRAVSTAYYAVFHAISNGVVETVFPASDLTFRQRARRWVNHGDVRQVSMWALALRTGAGGLPPRQIQALFAPPGGTIVVDQPTADVADAFIELHEKRQQADYDHEEVFSRADTRGHIRLAEDTVTILEQPPSPELRQYFGLIALKSRIQDR